MTDKDVDAFLKHHGIKGMKWGVRKASSSGSSSSTPSYPHQGLSDHQKTILKRVAIGAGAAAVVAGAAYAGVSLNTAGKLKLADLATRESVARGVKEAQTILHEPTDIIHATRGEHAGYQFVKKGGLHDPLPAYDKYLPHSDSGGVRPGHFKIHPNGVVAASFSDPHGRKDFAGRLIPHDVVIPKHMAEGLNNIEDVKKKIWPKISAGADEIYHQPKKTH